MKPLEAGMARVAALLLLPVALASIPGRSGAGTDTAGLYGTWAWTETSGGQLPGRSTPGACGCERLLLIRQSGTYEFVEQDSVNEYVLCSGRFTARSGGGLRPSPGWAADFVLRFDHWWKPYEHGEFLANVDGTDTLRMHPGSPEHGVDDALEHRFVRVSRMPKLTAQRIRLPLRERPKRSDVEIFPRTDLAWVEEPPVPTRQVRAIWPRDFEGDIVGSVVLGALVGEDGSVKDVQIVRGIRGLNDAAVEAARHWEFRPARGSNGKPIAAWIDLRTIWQFP